MSFEKPMCLTNGIPLDAGSSTSPWTSQIFLIVILASKYKT